MLTTWLSQLPNLDGREVDRYKLHRRIWEAFPDIPDGSPAPFQFCVDEGSGSILVRSTVAPRWQVGGVRTTVERHDWTTGDLVQVDVLLTPVRRHGGQEVPMTPEQEFAYVRRALSAAGLRPTSLDEDDPEDATPVDRRRAWVNMDPAQVRAANLNPWRVRGVATVTDADLLHAGIARGVGRKRYLGFGMLLLRPVDAVV